MPKVSIILPTYNGQAYIEEAITSILNQTFEDFELIVVDDCSTDHTPSLLESFRLQDSRIKIITNKQNLKLPTSLNVGHRMARGEYLTWTSDDNTLHSNFLERLVKVLETSSEDVVYSDFNVINDQSKHIRVYKVSPVSLLPFENGIGASFLYRKKVFQKFNYNEDLHGIEDYDFWVRTAQVFCFKQIEETLYNYRIHRASLTSQIFRDAKTQRNFDRGVRMVLENFHSMSPKTRKMLFQFQRPDYWNWNFYFKIRKEAEIELQNWILEKNGDLNQFNHSYNKKLRSLLFNNADRREILKAILLKPQLLSNSYSRKTTIEILKKLFVN
ncbi:glycosyltransferase family 2 protein [Leeuwenhoekiella nanhaiensis]|uniref:Glycosyltransferase 2-like domain-containing protein n=1 Tax=Leeuwenhoekiella nanhaiensis TaxID=1655491 RepID=A0A2G1VPG4_9FLAO|nr:glycosyltransferase [Leeuwenhoekiella nanhaiensis]PHQ28658.1 hypothetical protein CJ305_14210 [Leeuwenhoekiella nanhaiensis]